MTRGLGVWEAGADTPTRRTLGELLRGLLVSPELMASGLETGLGVGLTVYSVLVLTDCVVIFLARLRT